MNLITALCAASRGKNGHSALCTCVTGTNRTMIIHVKANGIMRIGPITKRAVITAQTLRPVYSGLQCIMCISVQYTVPGNRSHNNSRLVIQARTKKIHFLITDFIKKLTNRGTTNEANNSAFATVNLELFRHSSVFSCRTQPNMKSEFMIVMFSH